MAEERNESLQLGIALQVYVQQMHRCCMELQSLLQQAAAECHGQLPELDTAFQSLGQIHGTLEALDAQAARFLAQGYRQQAQALEGNAIPQNLE